MKIEDKKAIVAVLVEKIKASGHFYVTDIGSLNAANTSSLRKACFEKEVDLLVVKNTLLKKALEQIEGQFDGINTALKGNTAVMFCNVGNTPAKLIKDFRKGKEKPLLKAAYVQESLYLGDDQLESLVNIKSKDEMIGEVIGLLQSPIKNLLRSLESGKDTIGGLLKTLEERG